MKRLDKPTGKFVVRLYFPGGYHRRVYTTFHGAAFCAMMEAQLGDWTRITIHESGVRVI